MAAIKVGISIPTPCGDVKVYQLVNIDIPTIDLSFFLNFPPNFAIPWPDCSLLCRKNSAPEPAADSLP